MSNRNRNGKKGADAFESEAAGADQKSEVTKNEGTAGEFLLFRGASAALLAQARQRLRYLKANLWLVGAVGFLALGAMGAGLKYLDEDAQRELARRADKTDRREASFLSKINPFLPAAAPVPTPQLAKEYVYAGSRMLAVEDANAQSAPPADLAVWRPSSGVWYVLGGVGSQQFAQGFGQAGDIPTPGDYDGDGKTDLCIFRSSTSTWWVLKSSDGGNYAVPFGIGGDQPAPADYDGDGKTDIAVFRPSNGNWYISQSSNSAAVQGAFGLSSDKPAPADFDGDGRADLAVWRGSNSTYYSLASSDLQTAAFAFPQAGGEPVAADYDGDGRADYAIRRGADWIIRYSADNRTETVSWQQATDLAVQNDYDGDGRVDVAVWRNSNGNWYIRRSGAGGALRQAAWGTAGDTPVPAFYRR